MSFLVSVIALVVAVMAYKRAERVEVRLGLPPRVPTATPVQPTDLTYNPNTDRYPEISYCGHNPRDTVYTIA